MRVRFEPVFATLLFLACGPATIEDNASEQPSSQTITIGIAPPKAALQIGKSAQFTATVTGSSDKAVVWSVREPAGGAVTSDGLYTAPSSAGVFHLVAASHADLKRTSEAEITVTVPPPEIAVSIDPARVELLAGATARFHATVLGSDDGQVSWSAPDGGTVDTAGVFTAPANAGTFSVVATAHADPTKKAIATAVVSLPPSVVTVAISPSSFTVQAGGAQPLTATVTGTNDVAVTWSVQENGGGSVDQAGLYTAPQLVGVFHIVATSHADSTRSAVAVATVIATPRSISISPQTAIVAPGASIHFQATVTGVADARVQYSADGGVIDPATGAWTAPQSEGPVHITAQSVADPSLQALALVTVARSTKVTVKIEPNPVTIWPGDVAWMVVDVTGTADHTVTWSIREGSPSGSINQSVYPVQYSSPNIEGVFHIVATSNADPTASDVAVVTTSWNLRDGGGPVAANVHAYAIWWGDAAAFPSDEQSAVEQFLSTIDGSSYLAIADQFLRGDKAKVNFSGRVIDKSTPPDDATSTDVTKEICGQIAAQGMKPDPLGMYFVFTPSAPPSMSDCAFHGSTSCDGTTVLYAFVPRPTRLDCDYVQSLACNAYSVPTQSVIDYSAHELMEAITDPFGSAWNGRGYRDEMADRCNGVFDHCVSLGGAKWQIQEEWSNAAHGCIQE